MDKIIKFELLNDGSDGLIGNQSYKPLIFTEGEITVRNENGKLFISVDENTKTNNPDYTIEKTLESFNRGILENIVLNKVSKYKIKVNKPLSYVDQNGLYILKEVIDGNTFVFQLLD